MGAEGNPRQPWDPAPAQPAADPVAPEISRRVSAILDAAEREVSEIRTRAREEALRYMDYARRRADGLVAERQLRISELSGELLARAEHLLNQVESAEPLREALDDLVRKLTETAEGLTREAGNLDDFVAPDFSEVTADPGPRPASGPAIAETPPGPSPVPGPAPAPDPAPEPGPPGPPTPVPETPAEPPPAAATPTRPPNAPVDTAWPRVAKPAVSTPPPQEAPPRLEPQPPATEPGPARPSPQGAQMAAIQMAAAGATRAQVESHLRGALGVEDPASTLDDVFGPGSSPEDTVPWARPAPD